MEKKREDIPAILIVGEGKLTYSIVANALLAGQEVTLITADADIARSEVGSLVPGDLRRLSLPVDWPDVLSHGLAVAITGENLQEKQAVIGQLESRIAEDAIIAINTESIPLHELQASCSSPARILGLNWCYPAHLTFFMEIIGNAQTPSEHLRFMETITKKAWGKDPYTVTCGFSVRARIMAAWAREAFHLIDNGFASIESIDRACRNDAGHYLPFAGNFRYMDLMGTYAYGMVMKDLNPELSKASTVPESILQDFHSYAMMEDQKEQEKIFLKFSREIRELILKYDHEAIDC